MLQLPVMHVMCGYGKGEQETDEGLGMGSVPWDLPRKMVLGALY